MAGEKLSCIFHLFFSGGVPFSHLWGQAWKCFPVLNGLTLEHVAVSAPRLLWSYQRASWRLKWHHKVLCEIQQSLSLAFGMAPTFIFMTTCSYYMNDKFISIINIHIYHLEGITESRIVSSKCLKLAFEIICCAWRYPELKARLSLVCEARPGFVLLPRPITGESVVCG